ncbi:stearoyl-CoA desaturase 5-like protein, partial [Leptotrombidium deliense]
DRPYNEKISPRENDQVAFITAGAEGYHNFHHTFPWDYSPSELGSRLNVMKNFIDLMAKLNLAYDLKRATPEIIEKTRNETTSREKNRIHPYVEPYDY